LHFVDQGSFAHVHAAPEISGAAFCGETRLYPKQCGYGDKVRTKESLLSALKVFFTDNPGWQ
jgi:hypothetical protein